MSTKYPGGIDDNTSLPNPGSTDSTDNSDSLLQHHYQHGTENDALKAIETKLGTGASTPPGSNQILISTANGISSWGNLGVGGDLTGSLPNPTLVGSGVAAGTYGSSTQVPVFTVDGKGRITNASNVNVVGGGGGGGASPLTTKGDIWVYSTADTRLPVGSNGFILSADSTQATGLKWISAPTAAVWGNITGTLSSQTDLQNALNAKAANGANSDITSLSGLTTPLSVAQGGTGQSSTSITAKFFFAAPNGAAGSPTFRAIVASDIPTLNQNTTGSAATLTTGRTIQTNLASTSAATFDGSANITPGVTGTLPVLNGGTGATTSTGSGAVVLQSAPTITGHPTIESVTSTGATGTGKFVFDTSPVITTGTVSADPTANLGIASKQYVDNLGTGTLVQNETPGGSINGSNTAFTTASTFATGSLRVYLNGQRLTSGAGNDYVEGTQAFTMQYAPATGDVLLVDYNVNNTKFIQGSNSIVINEVPTGSINSSNTVFTTQLGKYVANTLEVFLNGTNQKRGVDYTETSPGSGTFTFTTAPATGNTVRINYQFSTGASGNADTVDGFHASSTATANTILPLDGNATYPQSVVQSSTLGYVSINTDVTTTSTTVVALSGLSSTVTIPSGSRKVKVSVFIPQAYNATAAQTINLSLWRGTVGTGTQVGGTAQFYYPAVAGNMAFNIGVDTPSAGSVTYNVGWFVGGGTGHTNSINALTYLLVELI